MAESLVFFIFFKVTKVYDFLLCILQTRRTLFPKYQNESKRRPRGRCRRQQAFAAVQEVGTIWEYALHIISLRLCMYADCLRLLHVRTCYMSVRAALPAGPFYISCVVYTGMQIKMCLKCASNLLWGTGTARMRF